MHNLTITNGVAEMFSGSNITPWHKLGRVVAGLLTAKQAIEAAGLQWEVEKKPVIVEGKTVEEYKAIVRKDTLNTLSIVGNRYFPIQNSEAFEFFDEVIGEGQAVYDTAGSLAGGKRVWIMAKLKGSLFLDNRPDDKIDKNVLLCTSHDGSSGLWLQIVSTRVVCQNTLSVALSGATNQIKIRHTKNYEQKKSVAMETLGLCNAYFDNLQAVINELDKQAMSKGEMVSFAEKLIPDAKEDKTTTRANNIRAEIVDLFSHGRGNLGKTRFDALNAVTEYVDHSRATKSKTEGMEDENRFSSSMFGSGAKLKAQAYSLLAV